MKTIICGAGDVGYSIADKLSKENFEVTVIDESDDRLSKVSESLDVKTIKGTPSLPSVLMDAGAQDCEILISCGTGGRSQRAAEILTMIGYKCSNISDGFLGNSENIGWKKNNLPCK